MNIQNLNFEGFYIKKPTDKKQIVLHHTVSGGSAQQVVNYWKSSFNKTGRFIGTHFIIDKQGNIFQMFDLKYWGGHIGDCSKSCYMLNIQKAEFSKHSIGIELVSFGALKENGGKLYNAYNQVYKGDFEKVNYKGYDYFAKYTDEQIKALEFFLFQLCDLINTSCNYDDDIWNITERALNGQPGIYSHTSYRFDKSDIYPDQRIIDILKNI